jgi:apolipoprotein N-acyltransferase
MLRALAFAIGAGLCLAISAPPRGLYALGHLGLVFWMMAADSLDASRKPGRWFLTGAVITTTINSVVLSWSVGLLVDFGHFPWVAAFGTSLLLWISQGLVGAFAMLFAYVLRQYGMRSSFALALTIPLATRLMPAIFPWSFSTSQLELLPFVQLASLGGTPLSDLVLVTVVALGYEAVRGRSLKFANASVGLLAATLLFGTWRIHSLRARAEVAEKLAVGVVQPNIGIREKGVPALAEVHLERMRTMTASLEASGADVVVWPETSYPFRLPRSLRREMPGEYAIRRDGVTVPVLFGAVASDHEGRYNVAVSLGSDGRVLGIADKVELMPFSERIPFWKELALVRRFVRNRGFVPGEDVLSLPLGSTNVGVLNCYEDVIDIHARHAARKGPTWLVNVTNDAWFGDTDEPALHNGVARFRAIETGRDLVRVVNTGISAHIRADGSHARQTKTYEQTSFVARVALSDERTPWTRFGDWVTPLLAGAVLALTFGARNRARSAIRASV